jgi:predicted RNA-binding Zn-ribbon protein involved in translation (DUF1610 family)
MIKIYDNGKTYEVETIVDAKSGERYVGCEKCGFPTPELKTSYSCLNCGFRRESDG